MYLEDLLRGAMRAARQIADLLAVLGLAEPAADSALTYRDAGRTAGAQRTTS
jgi:hypothetical protein